MKGCGDRVDRRFFAACRNAAQAGGYSAPGAISAESVLSRVREVTPHLPPRPAAGVDLEAVARHNLAPALAGATTPA
jgi:hypothetical protein